MANVQYVELLTPEFMTRLEKLQVVARKIFAGKMRGERRSKRKGISIEFADYRNYVAGDDLRFIDWNVYGRLEKLFLKLFLEEEDLNIHILIDCSKSMGYGSPEKLHVARQIAAAISYIGLSNLDRVGVQALSMEVNERFPPFRGKQKLPQLFDFLMKLEAKGQTHMNESVRTFTVRKPRKGVVILISDFLDRNGFEDGLKRLLGNKLEVYVFHVMAEQEIEPDFAGDLRLIDMEDGGISEVSLSRALLQSYKRILRSFQVDIQEYCTRLGFHYMFTSNQVSLEQLILGYLQRSGLLR